MKLQLSTVRRWLFRSKIDDLAMAYAAARKASDDERVSLEARWKTFQADVAAGKAEMVEEYEDGQLVYDHGEHFGELDSEVETALSLVRQAFVISLHHLWEREINSYMKTKRYVQEAAFAALAAEGLNVEVVELDRLQLTCNVAKHSSGNSATKLFKKHPTMFNVDSVHKEPGYANLIVTDADLESFFEAVRKSGFQPSLG
ncbi:hypothetical protein [Microvirga sp. P5_D2]